MIGRFLIVCIGLFMSMNSIAQTQVSGTLRNYANQVLYVYETLDEVSNLRKEVTNVRLNDAGNFSIELTNKEIQRYHFIIKNAEATFYAHPGRTYTLLTFPDANNSSFQRFDKAMVDLVWQRLPEDDCNKLIPAFNADLAQFLDDHFYDFAVDQYKGSEAVKARISKGRGSDLVNKTGVDTTKSQVVDHDPFVNWVEKFRLETADKYEVGFSNLFFSDYYRYSIAELELMAGKSKKELYNEYFMSQPVQPSHPAYMKFFLAYYDRVLDGRNTFYKDQILRIVNAEQDPSRLVTLLMEDSVFLSQNVGQLAVLNGLKTLFSNPNFSKIALKNCMVRMQELENCKLYSDVSKNVIYQLEKCKAGYEVPDLECLNLELDKVNLYDEVKGYTYIFFFADWCSSCKKEMLLMQKLQAEYGRDITFIAISVDETMDDMKSHIVSNKAQDFVFLFAGNNAELREAFNLRAIPHAVLLDPDGRYIYDYTRKPSEGINLDFNKIVKMLHEPKNGNTWQGTGKR